MRKAHYMRFEEGHHSGLDRLGGLPTHLPPSYPISSISGREMTFLGQFACHSGRLEVPVAICIQLYQGDPEDEPCPVVVLIPTGSPENTAQLGVACSDTPLLDIHWEERDDPEEPDDSQTDLAQSKIGGTCYFWDMIQDGESLILQLQQHPGRFNFGGYTAVVVRTQTGSLETRLG